MANPVPLASAEAPYQGAQEEGTSGGALAQQDATSVIIPGLAQGLRGRRLGGMLSGAMRRVEACEETL